MASSSDPKDQATLKRLRRVMENWIKETKDLGEIPESKKDDSDGNAKAKKRAQKVKAAK